MGINEYILQEAAIYVYYDKEYTTAFINAKNLLGDKVTMQVFDSNGKKITEQQSTAIQGYFTKDFVMTGLADGLYIIVLQTEKEKLVKKILKN